jgi:hypothetical protein
MARQVKKILVRLNILLTTVRTKLSGYFRTTIQAIGFRAVFLVTHGAGFTPINKTNYSDWSMMC